MSDNPYQPLIDEYMDACQAVRDAKMDRQKFLRRERMVEIGNKLKAAQTDLERDLTEMWKWLAKNPNHPRYAELDLVAVTTMNHRDRIEDAINAGINLWTGGRHPFEVVFDLEPVPEPPKRHPDLEPIAFDDPDEMQNGIEISARMREHNDRVFGAREAAREEGARKEDAKAERKRAQAEKRTGIDTETVALHGIE